MTGPLEKRIFSIRTEDEFNECALEIFRFQAENTAVYRDFLQLLQFDPAGVDDYRQIPFLPIELFKTRDIYAGPHPPELVFTSSATGGAGQSRHLVAKAALYEEAFFTAFRHFYGNPADYHILALLPSYLERENSSLVYMVQKLIEAGDSQLSGFFLNDHAALRQKLEMAEGDTKKSLLIGVSFGLLDFLETGPIALSKTIVMETGGMKGRRREMIREELHRLLSSGFSTENIHSEYGMSELLSQAYSAGGGVFQTPPWMRLSLREVNDPLAPVADGRTGGINVIDLANLYSCAFLATSDLGRRHPMGMEILGRFDFSDIRGCNLMVS